MQEQKKWIGEVKGTDAITGYSVLQNRVVICWNPEQLDIQIDCSQKSKNKKDMVPFLNYERPHNGDFCPKKNGQTCSIGSKNFVVAVKKSMGI